MLADCRPQTFRWAAAQVPARELAIQEPRKTILGSGQAVTQPGLTTQHNHGYLCEPFSHKLVYTIYT